MMARGRRSARLCDGLLRAAGSFVPADLRADWLREWRAEMAWRRDARAGRRRLSEPSLLLRCGGAWLHAAWLRWDRWSLAMLINDVVHALRLLRRRRGSAAVTVLTLAIGIGATASIFGAVRAVLLKPLPFAEPDRLVSVASTWLDRPAAVGSISPPDFTDWRAQNHTLADLAAFNASAFALSGDSLPAEQVPGAFVTGGFFQILGVPAVLGRTLTPQDAVDGGPHVAVISHDLWRARYGARPDVVGRVIGLDGEPYRLVGVMPAGFSYPLGSQAWRPLRFDADELATQRGAHYLDVIGRLVPGVSIGRARADLQAIAGRLAVQYPRTNRNSGVVVQPLQDAIVGTVRTGLLTLLAAVGIVLLVVCVNVAGLGLTRALERTREFAVRTALGAGRLRLVRSVLVESLLLAGAGGLTGTVMALWASGAIRALPDGLGIPLLDRTQVDGVVFATTLGISVAAALLFGAIPAWHAARLGDIASCIRQAGGTLTGDQRRQRLRRVLVIAEVSLAVALLVAAALLGQSFVTLSSVELGFVPDGVQTFNVSLPETKYETPGQRAVFVDTLVARLAAEPGVESAAAIFGLPLTGFGYNISTSTVDGHPLSDDEQDRLTVQLRVVTPDYFRVMRIPLLAGRPMGAGDRAGAPLAIVVSQAAARLYWPGREPLGRAVALGTRLGQGTNRAGGTVVGVAGDVHANGPSAPVAPTVYVAHAQFPVDFVTAVVRTHGDPNRIIAPARATLAELDGDLPMFRVRTLQQLAADAVARARLYMLLLAWFATAALLLSAVGVYGVLAHAVAQRTREIGIRLALGASRRQIVRSVLGEAVVLVVSGLVIGLAIAAVGGRIVRSLLFGVEPTDPVTYGSVAVVLAGIALGAALLPARRAARVDPAAALRAE